MHCHCAITAVVVLSARRRRVSRQAVRPRAGAQRRHGHGALRGPRDVALPGFEPGMLESKSKVLTSTLKSRYFRHESNVVHGPDTAEGKKSEKCKTKNLGGTIRKPCTLRLRSTHAVSLFRVAIVAGFEPARAMPIGFQVQRLNHSAILPEKKCCPGRTGDPKIKKKNESCLPATGFEPARPFPARSS